VFSGLTVTGGDSGVLIRPNVLVEFLDGRAIANDDGISLEGRREADRGLARAIVRRSVLASNTDDGVDSDRKTELRIEDSVIRENDDDGIEIRLQDDDDFAGANVTHVIVGNRFVGNRRDGLQLISYDETRETPRSFHVERNLFLENGYAGLGMMCDAVSLESFEGCPIPERVVLLHNSFVGNDHGLSGGADLIGVNNLIAGHSGVGVKNVVSPSLLAHVLFFANALDQVGSNVEPTSVVLADPLLTPESGLGPGSAAVDAGAATFVWEGETLLDAGPCEFRGAAPDLGAFERDTARSRSRRTARSTSASVRATTTRSRRRGSPRRTPSGSTSARRRATSSRRSGSGTSRSRPAPGSWPPTCSSRPPSRQGSRRSWRSAGRAAMRRPSAPRGTISPRGRRPPRSRRGRSRPGR